MSAKSFNIQAVNTNQYHVYIRIASILSAKDGEVAALAAWFLARSEHEIITIIWEEGMVGSLEGNKGALKNFSVIFNAITSSPAIGNLQSVMTQVFSGLGAYFTFVTNRVYWTSMGFLYFDGWKRGRKISDMDIALRSRWTWIESLLDRGLGYGWLSEDDVAKIRDGVSVWVKKTA